MRNLPERGVVRVRLPVLEFYTLCNISATANARDFNFYRAMLCIRGTSHGPVSVCLSVRPSVTSRCSTKTAKRRIHTNNTTRLPRDSSFLMPKISAIRPGSPPTRAPNAGGVGQNRRLLTNNRLYIENGTR